MNEISLNILAPCKGCSDRVLHCHSTCTKYKQYKERTEQQRSARRANAEVGNFLRDIKGNVIKRYNKRRDVDK